VIVRGGILMMTPWMLVWLLLLACTLTSLAWATAIVVRDWRREQQAQNEMLALHQARRQLENLSYEAQRAVYERARRR
jgi:hypothetical protein